MTKKCIVIALQKWGVWLLIKNCTSESVPVPVFEKVISSTPSLENVIYIKNDLKIQKGPYTKCESSSPINYMDSIQKLIINGGKTRKQTLRQIHKFIYFSRVASDRNTKSSGQTKICKFEFTILRKKNKITYNYFVLHTSGLY